MGCFSGCLMSSASIQKLFCGIYSVFRCSSDEFVGEKVGLPILFLQCLRTASSSAFSKSSLNIWEFMVHVLLKPSLENFEDYFTSM